MLFGNPLGSLGDREVSVRLFSLEFIWPTFWRGSGYKVKEFRVKMAIDGLNM
jgi:hypothetical protein